MKKVETIFQLLLFIQEKLKLTNNSNIFIDALEICEFVTAKKKDLILIYGNDYKIDKLILKKTKNIIKRIYNGEPLSYVLKFCNFYGYNFHINNNVFIPRADTECLVEYVIQYFKNENIFLKKNISILDLCCGSGCIGIALSLNLNCNVLSIDISTKALRLAKFNANKLNIKNKINFLKLDILNEKFNFCSKFDVIVCNPPYINYNEKIEKSVLNFEPKIALFAQDSGLMFYKHIIKNYKKYINLNGLIAFECGYLQSKKVYNIFKKNQYSNIKIIKDLSKINRIVSANI